MICSCHLPPLDHMLLQCKMFFSSVLFLSPISFHPLTSLHEQGPVVTIGGGIRVWMLQQDLRVPNLFCFSQLLGLGVVLPSFVVSFSLQSALYGGYLVNLRVQTGCGGTVSCTDGCILGFAMNIDLKKFIYIYTP